MRAKIRTHQLHTGTDHIKCSMLRITNEFLDEIRVEQGNDQELQQIIEWLGSNKGKNFRMGKDGILHFRERVCVRLEKIK